VSERKLPIFKKTGQPKLDPWFLGAFFADNFVKLFGFALAAGSTANF
jgi:hypothetical protein